MMVAKMLETNTTIQTLNLYNNKLGPEGAKAFAIGLEKNSTLYCIDLGQN